MVTRSVYAMRARYANCHGVCHGRISLVPQAHADHPATHVFEGGACRHGGDKRPDQARLLRSLVAPPLAVLSMLAALGRRIVSQRAPCSASLASRRSTSCCATSEGVSTRTLRPVDPPSPPRRPRASSRRSRRALPRAAAPRPHRSSPGPQPRPSPSRRLQRRNRRSARASGPPQMLTS